MGPKKVMKKAMKKSLGKGPKPLKQGKKGATALQSILKKRPATRASAPLKKGNLAKLGQMSLKEKVDAINGENMDEEEAVTLFKDSLTPDEGSQVWGQHQTYLKKNPLEKGEHDSLGKKEKGLAVALWYLNKSRKTFHNVSHSMDQSTMYTRKEKWLSEKQIYDRFTEYELECHLNSGRVIWRHDPLTRGCFEYQDLGDYTAKVNVCKRRSITAGQEYDPTEDDETSFLEEFSKDTNLQLKNAESLAKGDKGKGKGAKGSGSGQKGLGKGKGKHQQLALEDKKDESPEEESEDALGKARRARDLVSTKQCEVEEALAKVPKSFLSAGLKKSTSQFQKKLEDMLKKLKGFLLKEYSQKTLKDIKECLTEAATLIKDVKAHSKELTHMSNKTMSKTSSKK